MAALKKPREFDHTTHISFTELVTVLNQSKLKIQLMIDGGYILKGKDGAYPLHTSVQGAIRYAKDFGAKRGTGTKDATTARVNEARAKSIEQATALEAKELMSTAACMATVDLMLGGIRSELDGMPAQLTRDRTLRVQYETKVQEMLQRLSDKWVKMSKSIADDADVDEEDEE